MNKVSLAHPLIIASFFLLLSGCTKSTTSTSTYLGNWITSSDFDGNARSEAVIFTINDQAYLTTGVNDKTRYSDLWQYDADRKYWVQKADFPSTARSSAVAFSAAGKGYVGTGYDGVNMLKDFYSYDPSANTWTKVADFAGTARYDAVAFTLADKGYLCTGYDGNYKNDVWVYDPSTNGWTQKASLGGTKRSAAQSFVLNGKAYICSGDNNGTALQDLWMYNQDSDSWTQKRKIYNYTDSSFDDNYTNISRYNGVSFIMNNRAYLTTGENGSILSSTWEYDDTQDTWTQKTAFEGSARTGGAAFSIKSRGFVLTGRSGSLPYDNMMEFHPNEEQKNGD